MVHPLTPPQNQELTRILARENGRALDAIGSLYYTGETFDDFYPGKGSTYPDLNGSVGVLLEQAGSRGFHQDTEHGRLTFPFTIRNQLTTALATLRTALSQRAEFLNLQTTFYREAADACTNLAGAFVNNQVACSAMACCAETRERAYEIAEPNMRFFWDLGQQLYIPQSAQP